MRILRWTVAAIVALLLVIFAISNRQSVEVTFWPFPLTIDSALSLVVLGAVVLAFLVGQFVAWLGAQRWRHEAREKQRRIEALERELAASLPAVMGAYLLLDGRSGEPVALLDGPALTVRRTAAASALAASYLARPDCERLLMVGTGALAPHLVEAHACVRPIRNVLIWGRDADKATRLAQRLDRKTLKVAATTDLEAAVRGAHVISCATLSHEPLIRGAWLPLGVHLDLVGGFTPDRREADDDAVRRARVFVDPRERAGKEAGDIVQPLRPGIPRE